MELATVWTEDTVFDTLVGASRRGQDATALMCNDSMEGIIRHPNDVVESVTCSEQMWFALWDTKPTGVDVTSTEIVFGTDEVTVAIRISDEYPRKLVS